MKWLLLSRLLTTPASTIEVRTMKIITSTTDMRYVVGVEGKC